MYLIEARNANDALPKMIGLLRSVGVARKSRNGDVLVAPTPVTTVYNKPKERVLFCPKRDANPFFHLMEALWMLQGRDDIKTLVHYNRRMANFSDDGVNQHGAYGHRWKRHFGINQVLAAIDLLKKWPDTRRAVIQIYNPVTDFDLEGAKVDIPCNLTVTPWINGEGELDMTVFCRSNDVIWGAAGANIVHFSILQEYIANMVNVRMGRLWQVSNNFHAYIDILNKREMYYLGLTGEKHYDVSVKPYELMNSPDVFDKELAAFWEIHDICLKGMPYAEPYEWHNKFFPVVALPMMNAFMLWRASDKGAQRYLETRKALLSYFKWWEIDWLSAADAWLARRDDVDIERTN